MSKRFEIRISEVDGRPSGDFCVVEPTETEDILVFGFFGEGRSPYLTAKTIKDVLEREFRGI